ncbi:hypothetical protein HY496_00095 [Candidatus Woesearchaeota archaeon]|nr:hypothetical protein [Candidatus Woesearchaeota archaeon]
MKKINDPSPEEIETQEEKVERLRESFNIKWNEFKETVKQEEDLKVEMFYQSFGLDALIDLDYHELFKGSDRRKRVLNDLAILASFSLTVVPHELLHAGANILTGGENEKIVINRLYGGDLVHWLSPSIDVELLNPFVGGYVQPSEFGSVPGAIATGLAPYLLTPLAVYALAKGKEKKSLPLAIAGSGAVIGHVSGVLGDFLNVGRIAVYSAADTVGQALDFSIDQWGDSWLRYPLGFGAFYVGWKVMSETYSFCRNNVPGIKSALDRKSEPTSPSVRINLLENVFDHDESL